MPARLTVRDFTLFRLLGEIGCADTPVIRQKIFGDVSERIARRRLSILTEIEHIRRMAIGEYFVDTARRPYVYCLTAQGAQALRHNVGIDPQCLLPEDLNPSYVAHALGVSNFIRIMNDACDSNGIDRAEWMLEYATTEEWELNPDPRMPFHQRFVLHEKLELPEVAPNANGNGSKPKKSVSCRADAAFLLEFNEHLLTGFLEYDRSTETRAVIRRKVLAYDHMVNRLRRQLAHWNLPEDSITTTRIFFVTRTQRRLQSIVRDLKGRPGAELFRFAHGPSLTVENVLSGNAWLTVDRPDAPAALLKLSGGPK